MSVGCIANCYRILIGTVTPMDTLGKRLKIARGSVTQQELSIQIGIAQNSLSRYERDEKIPDAKFIATFCNILAISPEWLLFGHGAMSLGGEPHTLSLQAASASETAPQAVCPRCAELEEELKTERGERRELATENRQLWRENGELKERVARLEARIDRHREPPVEASLFDERPPIPSSSQATPPADKTI